MYYIFYVLVVQYFLVSNCKQFGYLKLFTCHCKDDDYCNYNGFCTGTSNGCATGWFGLTCQKQNVAFGKPADQSTEYAGRGPELAVDGDRTRNTTDKCMDTYYSNNRWWSVNLLDTYPIKQIHIFYRNNGNYLYTLRGYKIDVIQDNGTQVECYKQPDYVEPSSTDFVVTCNNVIWGNGINISSTSGPKHFFIFCEVEVYGLCSNRTYGKKCEKFCYCKDNVSCDDVTGECPTEECLPGYTGSSCNQPCDSGKYYGVNCSKDCNDRHCYGSGFCFIGTGRCTQGCVPGYNGTDCRQKCQTGNYGINCNNPCPTNCLDGDCHHINGSCIRGCKPGFTAEFCNQDCPETTYGLSCSNLCDNRKCSGSEECNHITGNCTEGCLSGYSGVDCSQNCPEGFYGNDCLKICTNRNCLQNEKCDNLNGRCIDGCKPGFISIDCTQECDEGFYGVNCSKKCSDRYCINNSSICDNENGNCNGDCHKDYSGVDCIRLGSSSTPLDGPGGENDSTMIIGAVLGSIVIILLVVIIVLLVYFRKRRSPTPLAIKDPPVVYDVITSSTNAVNVQVSKSTSTTTPYSDSQKHKNKPDNTIRNEPTLPEDHAYVNDIVDNVLPVQARDTNYDSLGTAYINENPYQHISK